MLRTRKKNSKGRTYLYEEKPENKGMELTGGNIGILLADSDDFVSRELYINGNEALRVTLCYIDGMIDSKTVSDDILRPLVQEAELGNAANMKEIIRLIEHGLVYYTSQMTRDDIDDTIADIINGSAALVFDGERLAVTFDVKGFEKRAVQEPTDENIVKGAKDSFVEVLRVNTTLLRRKLRTQNLRIKEMSVGQQTLTPVAVCYINGICNPHLVEEVIQRLQHIDIDGVLVTSGIEEYIIDYKFTAFPLILYTERPDKFCSNLLEGKAGILIDGLPLGYTVPGTIVEYLQAPEDYSRNFILASIISIIRYFSVAVTLFLPGFYISISSFHQEMIPTELALTIIASKEGVPYPVFIETFMLLVAFEILMEAGLRMPKPIGQAVSVVGALVVGQSAVEAKIISPAVVIVVAITVFSGFTMPNQDFANALRVWRFIMTILSSISGLFGLTLGMVGLLLHLATLETFGVAYLSTFVANEGSDMGKDTIIRMPVVFSKKRPRSVRALNKVKQK